MPIWSPNLKKCLVASFFWSLPAFAIPEAASIKALLLSEMKIQTSPTFDTLLESWSRRFGSEATGPLLEIALDPHQNDHYRYMALIAATAQTHSNEEPKWVGRVVPLLKDPSWMVRSGAMKSLSRWKGQNAEMILPLLEDKALVIRSEALELSLALGLPGLSSKLIKLLNDKNNYHHGKALWIAPLALDALVTLRAHEEVPKLKDLLSHREDPEFVKKTVATLEKLTGKTLESQGSLSDKVLAWKKELSPPR